MSDRRDPLGSVNLNLNIPSTSYKSGPIKLAPIFEKAYKRPAPLRQVEQENESSAGPSKRARRDVIPLGARDLNTHDDDDDDEENAESERKCAEREGIASWFTTTSDHSGYGSDTKEGKRVARRRVEPSPSSEAEVHGCWRRRRGRFGLRFGGDGGRFRGDTMMSMASQQLSGPQPTPYLQQLVHSLLNDPDQPPSMLFIPSLHPWNYPRDYAPPLAVHFSRAAKLYDQAGAKAAGLRRLIAVAAEEGGVRVVDCDEGLGPHRDAKGWFWRAHGNAVLDIKWTPDDTGLLTASGDQSARIHALDAPTPTLRTILRGHTASVKTAQYFDLSRSYCELDNQSTVITGSRDGSMLLFDVRAPGKTVSKDVEMDGPRRSSRQRYSNGVPGFAPQEGQEIGPVIEIKNAHSDGSRKKSSPKSVTAIACLSSKPGIVASGGSADGVVRLWDPRNLGGTSAHPRPVSTLPDPTCLAPGDRPRGIHSMVEQPTTGDLFALTADSKVHVLRPSAAQPQGATESLAEAIQPVTYGHPHLRSNFWISLAFSPCGRYLASGSPKGGIMTWDTAAYSGVSRHGVQEIIGTRFGMGPGTGDREINAVDWGYDMIAGCADDSATRIWRRNDEIASKLKEDRTATEQEWAGYVP